ncbi:hypothetical protein [Coleofasciculus sp.]|uniref:hypothetical protein n=1 Tax=Coleofasciculus sp. TaxID=3100458 RepID=UPI003A1772AD
MVYSSIKHPRIPGLIPIPTHWLTTFSQVSPKLVPGRMIANLGENPDTQNVPNVNPHSPSNPSAVGAGLDANPQLDCLQLAGVCSM